MKKLEKFLRHTPLLRVINFFKKEKNLFVVIPTGVIIFLFIIYGLAVWIKLFIIFYKNDFSFYGVLDIAAGQWAEFMVSYTPQWLYGLTSWTAVFLNVLWSVLNFIPTMMALMWGFLLIIRGVAYLFGFLGHIFLFLKKLILDR
jgi:hypothetical protein